MQVSLLDSWLVVSFFAFALHLNYPHCTNVQDSFLALLKHITILLLFDAVKGILRSNFRWVRYTTE